MVLVDRLYPLAQLVKESYESFCFLSFLVSFSLVHFAFIFCFVFPSFLGKKFCRITSIFEGISLGGNEVCPSQRAT